MNKHFKAFLTTALIGAGGLTSIAPTQASEASFSTLPIEIMGEIASYLTPYELENFEQVSTGCQALCTPSTWTMVARPFKDDYKSTNIWDKNKVVVHLLRMKLHTLPLDSVQSEIDNIRNKYPTLISAPRTKYCSYLYKNFLHINDFNIQTYLFNNYTIVRLEFDQMTNEKDRKMFLESLVAENNQSAIEIKYEELMEDAQDSDAALQFLDKLAANVSRAAQYLYAFHIAFMELEPDVEKAKKYIQDHYISF